MISNEIKNIIKRRDSILMSIFDMRIPLESERGTPRWNEYYDMWAKVDALKKQVEDETGLAFDHVEQLVKKEEALKDAPRRRIM